MWITGRVVCGALAAVVVASSSPTMAEDKAMPSTHPGLETGLVTPISFRPQGYPAAGDPANALSVGLTGRIETGILGIFLRTRGFYLGEYLALEFGMTHTGDLSGRLAFGLQAAYEINNDFGVGVRVMTTSVFEDLLPGSFGSHWNNYILSEVAGRYRSVIGRVRFPIAKANESGSDGTLFGLSLRIPTSLHLMGYRGWQLGFDYERMARPDSMSDPFDTTDDSYVIHRFGVLLTLAI